MNHLIIFDIDGTLIHYIEAEDQIYLDAIHEIMPINNISSKWDEYYYSTESGILSEIFSTHLKRLPTLQEEYAIKDNYVSSLARSLLDTPNSCLAGATEIFSQIKQKNWDIAIATGAWLESAKVKLTGSNMPYLDVPFAHGGDHHDRTQIIQTAIARSKAFYKKDSYQKIIYVGDRLWDRKAALELNIDFIGVGDHLASLEVKDFFHVDHYETPEFLSYLR